jgi:hypothetical protein
MHPTWVLLFPLGVMLLLLVAGVRGLRNSYRTEGLSGAAFAAGGFLVGLFLAAGMYDPPSVARPAARRTQCKNNLKQIGLGLHNYHDIFNHFPMATYPGGITDRQRAEAKPGKPPRPMPDRSWRVTLLPYIDHQPMYDAYDPEAAWDSPTNAPLQLETVRSYDCQVRPSRFDDQQRFLSAYSAVTGKGTVFENDGFRSIRSITDGTPNTLLVVETCGVPIIWTEPKDVSTDEAVMKINAPGDVRLQSNGIMSSYHLGGAQVLLGDGSVRFVSQNIDADVLRALLTRDADDQLPQEW